MNVHMISHECSRRVTLMGIILLICIINPVSTFDFVLTVKYNQFVSLRSKLLVPPVPPKPAIDHVATYFLWPGLQPGYQDLTANFQPIGNGVLQPVLTYGPACTPNQPPGSDPYRGWWISGQYVNTNGTTQGYNGCHGGPVMDVQPGDILQLDLILVPNTTTWNQTVTSTQTGNSVSYSIDMQGQSQGRAELAVELYWEASLYFDVTFTDIELKVALPQDNGSNYINIKHYHNSTYDHKFNYVK
ncbi:hypothetical protein HDU76_010326 [Blyttiomyces sp. JEL0837]|nr:hypothetical protein HDU76_010326 [Blyttiomyces sp. JEL0837]